MVNSRNKGKAGELELAHELTRLLGVDARRGQQFSGSPDSPDVRTNLPGLHIECKRVERFNLYDALAQSARDAGPDEIPIVCHRRNRTKWVVIVELDRLTDLANLLERHLQKRRIVPPDHGRKSQGAG